MRNRWFIALAAIGLHISIGSVYAWSVPVSYTHLDVYKRQG